MQLPETSHVKEFKKGGYDSQFQMRMLPCDMRVGQNYFMRLVAPEWKNTFEHRHGLEYGVQVTFLDQRKRGNYKGFSLQGVDLVLLPSYKDAFEENLTNLVVEERSLTIAEHGLLIGRGLFGRRRETGYFLPDTTNLLQAQQEMIDAMRDVQCLDEIAPFQDDRPQR